jgi:hypothetical protein
MLLAFRLSFVVDIFGLYLTWQLFGLFFKNLAIFSNLLVTLDSTDTSPNQKLNKAN